jgi:hypothetical protein
MSEDKFLKAIGSTKKGRDLYQIAYNAGLSYGQTWARVKALVAAGKVMVVGKAKVQGPGRPATLYTAVK